jgi:hypothetical protein
MKYAEIIGQMSLEEKAGLCSGKDMWHTKAKIKRSVRNGLRRSSRTPQTRR